MTYDFHGRVFVISQPLFTMMMMDDEFLRIGVCEWSLHPLYTLYIVQTKPPRWTTTPSIKFFPFFKWMSFWTCPYPYSPLVCLFFCRSRNHVFFSHRIHSFELRHVQATRLRSSQTGQTFLFLLLTIGATHAVKRTTIADHWCHLRHCRQEDIRVCSFVADTLLTSSCMDFSGLLGHRPTLSGVTL